MIAAVLLWGASIACLGLVRTLAAAVVFLAIAGFADGVSSICRSTINQTVTPDALRGRMSAVYSLVINGGPRLGDVESGIVAGLTSAATSVLAGGLACLVGLSAIILRFPELAAYDSAAATRSHRVPVMNTVSSHGGSRLRTGG